jgi:hypothetical protein
MAENKKGFILYANYIGTIKQLPDDVAGRLMKHIFSYVNDENPQTDELLINVVFEQIKAHLKADLEKYILGKHDKSLSGRIGNLKRWHKDLYDEFVSEKLTLDEAEKQGNNRTLSQRDSLQSQQVAEIAVIANAIVIETVIDNVIDNAISNNEDVNNSVTISNQLKIDSPHKIDLIKFQKFFNDNRGLLPEVKKISDARKKRIQVLEKQYGKECLMIVIEKTRDSPFLQGQNQKNWIASFDWIFTPANFLKILEDNYAKRTNTSEKSNAEIFTDAVTSETGRNFRL